MAEEVSVRLSVRLLPFLFPPPGSSHSLDRAGGSGQLQDQKILAKLERINTDLEDRNVNLEEENNMLKIKVKRRPL